MSSKRNATSVRRDVASGALAWPPCAPCVQRPELVHDCAKGSLSAIGQSLFVRYGANDSFYYRWVNGHAPCTNQFFGGDPAPGIVKRCQVNDGM